MPPFKTVPKKFKSWSNSRWNDYDKCPALAKYKHLDKLPEPKSLPMERGIYIAKQEEDYFLGKVKQIPPDIHKDLHPLFRTIKAKPGLMVEQNWGFDINWQPIDYFDWNNCWLRVKVDVAWFTGKDTAMSIRDNKTGKFRQEDVDGGKYTEQLELYSAAGIGRFPKMKLIDTGLIYTDQGFEYPRSKPMMVRAAEALKLQKEWTRRVAPMFVDTRFNPRPGHYCNYCHFRKANRGPCKY